MRSLLAAPAVAFALIAAAAGHHHPPAHHGWHCNLHPACAHRVRVKRDARELARYHAHPMPWCTWGPESGRENPEWGMVRYTAVNPDGGAGGKFQFLPSTWTRVLGMSGAPQDARPVLQEREARRLLALAGLGQWVNC